MFRLRVELRWTRLITKDDGPCLASLNCSNLSLKESTLWHALVGVLGLLLFPGLNMLLITMVSVEERDFGERDETEDELDDEALGGLLRLTPLFDFE